MGRLAPGWRAPSAETWWAEAGGWRGALEWRALWLFLPMSLGMFTSAKGKIVDNGLDSLDFSTTSLRLIPEPSTLLLAALVLLGLLADTRRKGTH